MSQAVNSEPKPAHTRLRGLILTEQALNLFDQELRKAWDKASAGRLSETKKIKKLSREEKGRLLDLTANTIDRIYHRDPVDVQTLQNAFSKLNIPFSKGQHCVSTPLPYISTPCIGREVQLAEIKSLMESTPLVTLTGVGGIGKTRLALHIAEDVKRFYPAGVWFIELTGVSDPALVPQTVAAKLGIQEEQARPLVTKISDFLRDKPGLLVLDNCEHLLQACATLVHQLLSSSSASSHLRILATSRECLNIAFERPYLVPALSIPDRQRLPEGAEEIEQWQVDYGAVRLFVERAKVHTPKFTVTSQDAPLLTLICQRLDGNPLALELAAACVNAMSLDTLEPRLDDRFRLLTEGSTIALPHQQTLQATMDWSYGLLTEKQRTMLRRLSVFADGCSLEAAEQVCASGEIEVQEVLNLLRSLVAKSLVVYREEKDRYHLLETVREYGWDRLAESGERNTLQNRHRECFLALAEEAEPYLLSGEQEARLLRLEAEHANLHAALEWSLIEAGSAACLRICGALGRFWYIKGHLTEGRNWCRQALETANSETQIAERAKALFTAGGLAFQQGDYRDARSSLEESLALYQQSEDKNGMARTLNTLASVITNLGDCATALDFYQQSLVLSRETGNQHEMTRALNGLGGMVADQSDYVSARSYFEESLDIYRKMGNLSGVANVLKNLGFTAHLQGDYKAANRYFVKSQAVCKRIEDRSVLPYTLCGLGLVAFSQGEYEIARPWYEQGVALCKEIGDQSGLAYACTGLANVAEAQSDFAFAQTCHTENLLLYREVGKQWGIITSFKVLAELAVKESKFEQAAVLWGITEALRKEYELPVTPREDEACERAITQARQSLNTEDLLAAWAEGVSMTLEQAIEYVLEECE